MITWFISKYASLPKYGAASRLFHLANEFNKQGHQTILITSDSNHLCDFPKVSKVYNQETIDCTEVHWIKTRRYEKTASFARILSWFDFEFKLLFFNKKQLPKPDVVIISSLSLLSIINGFFLKVRYKAKLVFEVRDIWPLTMTEEGGFSKWHPLVLFLRAVEKFGYRNADLVVGTMPRLDLHVQESIGKTKPFFCSPIGFDSAQWAKNKRKGNNNFEPYFPKGKIIIGYAGSMGISNALDPFIDAIQRMREYEHVHFVVTGGGDLRKNYEKQLEGQRNVTFVPRIKADEVPEFLGKCDILYLSTQDSIVWQFGQSMNKVVEYMLAGKPIIASYSGYPSMLDEAESGVFVSDRSAQAIVSAILDYVRKSSEERECIGGKGAVWVLQNRSYDKLARDYIEQLMVLNK